MCLGEDFSLLQPLELSLGSTDWLGLVICPSGDDREGEKGLGSQLPRCSQELAINTTHKNEAKKWETWV